MELPGRSIERRVAKAQRDVAYIGILALAATIGGVVEAWNNSRDHLPRVTTTQEATLGNSEITTMNYDIGEESIVGYSVAVGASTAKNEVKIGTDNATLPTGTWWSSTFRGSVDVDLCQEKAKVKAVYNPKIPSAEVYIPLDALKACTKTDLTNRHFSHKNGLGTAVLERFKPFISALPIIATIPGISQAIEADDSIWSWTENAAEIQANEQAAVQCADKVWAEKEMRDSYRKNMAETAVSWLSLVDPKITTENVFVFVGAETPAEPDMEQELGLKTDLSLALDNLKKGNGVDLTATGIGTCEPASNPEKINETAPTPSTSTQGGTQ